MEPWKVATGVAAILFAVGGWLGGVLVGRILDNQARITAIEVRLSVLEAQHDAPPAAHSGPGSVPNPDRGAD